MVFPVTRSPGRRSAEPALQRGGVLVIQTAYIGDVILTTPLLAALAEQYGPVDVVVRPAAVNLLETHPAVRDLIPFDKDAGGAGRLLATLRRISRRRYGTAYLPHRSLRSAALAALARIPRRVGFSDAPGRWLYTERRPRRGARETGRLLALADTRTATADQPSVALTAADHRVAAAVLTTAGITEPCVVIAPGSAWATKRWPYFAELARRIAERQPVLIIGDARDAHLLGDGTPPGTSRIVDLAGRLTLRESAALLARAALAVTNDSAPLHLASAVGTPVVAIFGPTTPSLGFVTSPERVTVAEGSGLPCRPCTTHGGNRCPLGHHRCMKELSVDDVLDLIGETRPERRAGRQPRRPSTFGVRAQPRNRLA